MTVICWNGGLDRLTLRFKRCHAGQAVDTTVNYVTRRVFFFFANWIYVLIGRLHMNIMLIYTGKQTEIHTLMHVQVKARVTSVNA